MKKVLLGVVLGLSATAAMADGLSFQSSGINSPIKVTCNGSSLPFQMQPNSSVKDISWFTVSMAFSFAKNLNCNFSLADATQKPIGSASMIINGSDTQGEVVSFVSDPAYTVNITPAIDTYETSLTVGIQKK